MTEHGVLQETWSVGSRGWEGEMAWKDRWRPECEELFSVMLARFGFYPVRGEGTEVSEAGVVPTQL